MKYSIPRYEKKIRSAYLIMPPDEAFGQNFDCILDAFQKKLITDSEFMELRRLNGAELEKWSKGD